MSKPRPVVRTGEFEELTTVTVGSSRLRYFAGVVSSLPYAHPYRRLLSLNELVVTREGPVLLLGRWHRRGPDENYDQEAVALTTATWRKVQLGLIGKRGQGRAAPA